MELIIGKSYCVSVMALYEKIGQNLEHGFIRKTVENECEYYDIIVNGRLVCADGEENELVSIENGVYTFKNEEGDFGYELFKLTDKELEIALYGAENTIRFVGHQVSEYDWNKENLDLIIEAYFNDNPIWIYVDIANGNENVFLIDGVEGELDIEIDQSLITEYIKAHLYDEKGNMIMVS